MTDFVLVHGAFHGAWCWTKLVAELEQRGHRANALDMPGNGEDRTPLAQVTFASYIERIVEALHAAPDRAVLVGHSLGTMAVSAAAEAAPARVRDLVLLGGVTPRDGMSLYTLLQLLDAPGEPIRVEPPPGHPWSGVSQEPQLDQAATYYYNDCSEADVAYAMAHLRPQANAPRVTPLTLTERGVGSVRRSFIGCSRDNACPVKRQQATLALDPYERAYSLPTGHSPFFSAPGPLADLLCGL